MGVKFDFHTHILPDIDDGSKSVDESLQMLAMEKEMGVDTVVLTPHFYPQSDQPHSFLARRQRAFEKLTEAAAVKDNLPQLKLGAEVYYFNGIGNWEGLKDFAIEGTNYVLIEMPFSSWTDRMYDELDSIYHNLGLVPVVAHIERYINIFTANKVLNQLAELKVVVQSNAEFFIDKKSRKLALKMLKDSDINILGTDCHNLTDRKPNLSQAEEIICAKLGGQIIDKINLTAEKILTGF